MKCIKRNGSDVVIRVSDKEARKAVRNGNYTFCPKWAWKDQKGKPYKGERK